MNTCGFNNDPMTDNPLSYCIGNNMGQRFMHGSNADIYGDSSSQCQNYMSQYCADNWNYVCEYVSQDTGRYLPNSSDHSICYTLTKGEALVHNTAKRKYLIKMLNCCKKYEPFDPLVPTSPMISYYEGLNCVPVYSVDASVIDQDPVMDKILANPRIAVDILINIYNTMKRENTLHTLDGTKLGRFYATTDYFKNL